MVQPEEADVEQVVVVGFDGSKSAMEALRWAGDEAERRGWGVHVIESWRDPVFFHRSWVEVWEDPDLEERQAQAELDAAVATVAADHPDVPFATDLTAERPSQALTHASEDVPLVVVGARGRGGFSSLVLGSVSQHVAAHGASNVVVIRGLSQPDGEVVVGVDGSEPSRLALAWAAEAARLHARPLRVVMAWSWLAPLGERGREPFRAEWGAEDAALSLHAIVADVVGFDSEIDIELEAVYGLPAATLIERGEDAALLVVGPRARSMTTPAHLGSVALQVLHHAPCPLVIVRAPSTRST